MGNISCRNFNSGWRPSDDPINGDPNGLLQMNNVDLDTNGALSLIGGTAVVGTAFTNNLHSLYSRTMAGTRRIYSADVSGGIFRDNTSIGTSGDSAIAAFGTAFNYVLACSGNTRKKDSGSGTPANLGVTAPTAAPAFIPFGRETDGPYSIIASLVATYAMYTGTAAVITESAYPSGGGHARPSPIKYLQVTADANGQAVFQTASGSGDPHNLNTFSADGGSATDNDIIPFFGYVTSPWGCSVQIDILTTAGNAFADQVGNFFTYKITDLADLEFDPYTGVFHTYIKRSDFSYVGNGEKNWSTAYGVRITFNGTSASQVINFLGDRADPVSALGGAALSFYGGTHAMNGIYEFAQVNVNNTGSYLALSPLGPVSAPVPLIAMRPYLDIEVPTDTQVNEVWIFARSSGDTNAAGISSSLNGWYRVAKQTTSLGANIYPSQDDLTTLTLNIRYNQNLVTIASSTISDKILSIVGPIQKRWYYFTTNMMYPSDIDNPDLVDSSIAIRTTGSNNEIFLWAKQINQATVLVGTSCDVYVLSGTFATLPDFSVDIYYHGLGCKYPPISYDADVFAGSVFYLANDGWRFINESGSNDLIVSPQTDKLYRGLTSNGYTAPNLKVAPGSVRFPVVIARNKLWCFITGTDRVEVFDFIRKYWRVINYSTWISGALCATSTQDGQVVAFYDSDNKIREIDVKSTKYVDADSSKKLRATLLWTVRDGGLPRNRKDSSTFKSRVYTGGTDTLSVTIVNEAGNGNIVGTLASATQGLEKYIDLSQDAYVALCKTYKVSMTGFVADLLLEDWSIDYAERPEQLSFKRILPQNFGSASKKRVRNWPLVIDTLGNNVIWTPDVDGSTYPSTTLNSSKKSTKNTFYTSDAFGVDYAGTLYCSSGLFEFYDMLPPAVVQVLPIAKRFDQIGPEEMFKYGKIKQFEFRVLPSGGSSIPYTIYFSDTSSATGTIAVADGKEDSYFIDVPKGTSGRILRLVFGATSFDFHRFYVRVQVASSGKDTELNWITIANE